MIEKIKYWLYRLQFNHPEFFNHKPIHLDLELVRACNLKCPFCYRQEDGFVEKFPAKFMDLETALKLLHCYYKRGLRSVKFNWRGEPLLHPEIGRLARVAKSKGFLDRMINTNLAVPLTRDFLDNLDYFTDIRVSLDTMIPELYEQMRPPAKLQTVIDNLAILFEKYNSKKTRIIIQRRTTEKTESDRSFDVYIWAEFAEKSMALANKWEKYKKIISKPVQPRVKYDFQYSNGTNRHVDYEVSYFEQWRAGKIDRQYCKQPSQRVVVGVDGKEWSCCLAYTEDKMFAFINRKNLIYLLKNYPKSRPGPAHPCYKCTSFTAYKEKKY